MERSEEREMARRKRKGEANTTWIQSCYFFYMISFSDGYPYPTDEELRPGKFKELLDVYPGSK